MHIITWVKERYVIFLLLRAERLQRRAYDWRWIAHNYARRANLLGNKISAYRYHLNHLCAKSRRRAYMLGVKASAAEVKAYNFIYKHKLKGFN